MAQAAASAPFVLACRSLVLGTCNLLVLGLPPGWRLVPAGAPPEVDRWRVLGDVNWALAGRVSFHAWGPGPGGGRSVLAGEVEVAPLGSRAARSLGEVAAPLRRVDAAGERTLGAHPGRWARGAVRRGVGPWGRWVPALAVGVECPRTGRRVRVLVEADRAEVLPEVLDALAEHLRCC